MIVCDEADIMARCLRSLRDHIDHWVICDTGSSDDTVSVVQTELAGVPGELHRHAWEGFAANRFRAVELARRFADYVLIVDADMTLNVVGDYRSQLSEEGYLVRYEGSLEYYQPMLLSARHHWRFVGATHEFVTATGPVSMGRIASLMLTHHCDGASRRHKLSRDIALLEQAARDDPADSRTAFYLAQSLREAGQLEKARAWYERRAAMGGWDEEVWYSLYQLARITELRQEPAAAVSTAYRRAYRCRPSRLETVPGLARSLRRSGRADEAYELTRDAMLRSKPEDILFVELDAYRKHVPLEHAGNCSATGRWAEALGTVVDLLDVGGLDEFDALQMLRLQSRCLRELFPPKTRPEATEHSITVLLPFYNAGPFLARAVESLLAQNYSRFRVAAYDDGSSDGCAAAIPHDPRFTLVTSRKNEGAAHAMHHILTNECEPEDVVVHLDGDDWLATPNTLSNVSNFYSDHDCWVAYGQYQTTTGQYGSARPFPHRQSFERLRSRHAISHLRTFRAGLYRRIADQDPGYTCMKDQAGQFVRVAMDVAIMNPLSELAGFDRVRFNERVLYTYNLENPLSVFRIDPDGELAMARELRARPPFQAVESYN